VLTAFLLSICLAAAVGCGGNSSSSSGGGGGGNGGGGSGGGSGGITGGGAISAPIVVNVASAQPVSGVDIAVNSATSSPTPNANSIGVAQTLSGASASNTGTTISQGTTMFVLLFGQGLSGNVQVMLSGPADITVSNIQSIMATDGTPGVAFQAAVASNAALGGRTVVLQDSNDDISTFTGSLEVVP
jgi:hypothetical protein